MAVTKAVQCILRHEGFRSLGVARAEGHGPWQFIGVLPVRSALGDAKSTIATASKMGVQIQDGDSDAARDR